MNTAPIAPALGHFAQLQDGKTHYHLDGPQNEPLIVLVHGLTTPSFVFEALAPRLIQAGHRVLRYDLFGRGGSDRPDACYGPKLYARQLDGLLGHLGVDGPFVLLGYSMGGAIAAAWAVQNPARMQRLILLAPGGLGHDLGWFLETSARTGPFGDLLMAKFGAPYLRRSFARPDPACQVPDFARRLAGQPASAGYLRAVLRSIRRMLADQTEVHRRLSALNIPTFAIWGEKDPVIPLRAMERMKTTFPQSKHVVIPGADHDLPHKFPDQVMAALLGVSIIT